jgi:hypothetical protein
MLNLGFHLLGLISHVFIHAKMRPTILEVPLWCPALIFNFRCILRNNMPAYEAKSLIRFILHNTRIYKLL